MPDEIPVAVVLVGTLDTKGAEYRFLRARLLEHKVDVVVDAGVLGRPDFAPNVTRYEVASAAGVELDALAEARDRTAALAAMSRGAAKVVSRLYTENRLDGLAGLGGTGGSLVVAGAAASLPVGVPKLLVSTVASGDTRPYVGGSDLTMTYSVVDIAGVNRVSARVFDNAAAAIAGMALRRRAFRQDESRPVICASMFGVTTPCVTHARQVLEELGYGPGSSVPDRFRGRRLREHTPAMSSMRTTPEECAELGHRIPRSHLDRSRAELHELDLDINDTRFAEAMAIRLHELCQV